MRAAQEEPLAVAVSSVRSSRMEGWACTSGPSSEANSWHFLLQEFRARHSQSTEESIPDRIGVHGTGWVFTTWPAVR